MTMAALSNQSIIALIGMEVYNSFFLNFKEIAYIHHEIESFENHSFPIHFLLWRTTLSSIIENVWENHDFQNSISDDVLYIYNLFEILKGYCRPPYLLKL